MTNWPYWIPWCGQRSPLTMQCNVQMLQCCFANSLTEQVSPVGAYPRPHTSLFPFHVQIDQMEWGSTSSQICLVTMFSCAWAWWAEERLWWYGDASCQCPKCWPVPSPTTSTPDWWHFLLRPSSPCFGVICSSGFYKLPSFHSIWCTTNQPLLALQWLQNVCQALPPNVHWTLYLCSDRVSRKYFANGHLEISRTQHCHQLFCLNITDGGFYWH